MGNNFVSSRLPKLVRYLLLICGAGLVLGYALLLTVGQTGAQQPSTPAAILDDDSQIVQHVAWQPTSGTVLAVAANNDIRLYTSDLQPLTTLQGHTETVYKVAWKPDGTLLASASDDRTVRLWDAEAESTIAVLEGFNGSVVYVAWSPDGNRLAVTAIDSLLAASDRAFFYLQAFVWDVSNPSVPSLVYALPKMISVNATIIWSPDSSSFMTTSYTIDRHYDLNHWRADDGELLVTLPYSYSSIYGLGWQPDGDLIVVATESEVFEIMDAAANQVVIEFHGDTHLVTSVDWSPDGAHLTSGSRDGTIRVWDVATASVLLTLTDTSDVYQVKWSPDGTKLATLNAENDVKIWDVSSLPDVSGTPTVTPFLSLTPPIWHPQYGWSTPTPTATERVRK